ncbi:MAG: hypothetical protein IJV49_00620 [Aeriscardovia sp.]|nr:hypothetical protein [Aeriscardovia sp.]
MFEPWLQRFGEAPGRPSSSKSSIFFVAPVIGVTGKVDGPATGSALAIIVHRLFMPREESRRAVRP